MISTTIGMMGKDEVCEVTFDAARLPFADLLRQAKTLGCRPKVFARSDAQAEAARKAGGFTVVRTDAPVNDRTQQQYDLAHRRDVYLLPLTASQASRLNAIVARGADVKRWLAPFQIALWKRLKAALKKTPARFKGLEPDRSITGMPAYAARLEALLRRG